MAVVKQKTIGSPIALSGEGLHTGCKVQLTLRPAPAGNGIRFIRMDLPGRPVITADPSNIHKETWVPRCTTISNGAATVHTVEHLMSVLCGLGITNADVELDGKEIPGLDGSGLEFLKAIKASGIVEQDDPAPSFAVREAVGVSERDSSIFIVPAADFKVSYVLDYGHPMLHSQYLSVSVTPEVFEKEICASRTFCLENEVKELRSSGLGLGANYKNTLVVGEKGVIDNTLRFKDEFARHKVLDLIGDLYLLGMPLKGHVFAFRSGHRLNVELLKKVHEQQKRSAPSRSREAFKVPQGKEIDISTIMKILPHRYPFLLVDRVIEIDPGKKAVGIKNVTINDSFFQGHFPTRPVMPGVLMVEAMAQTGGVVVLTNEAHRGKVAFFMAIDNVKFRKVVYPGDQLMMEVEVVKDRQKFVQIHAQSKVNGEVVAEADMVLSFTDASYLD